MASALSLLNRLLPFATPGTPLVQDLLHLAAICGALYFAPQVQEWYRSRQGQAVEGGRDRPEEVVPPVAGEQDDPRDAVDGGRERGVNQEVQEERAGNEPAVAHDDWQPQQPHAGQAEAPDQPALAGPANIPDASAQRSVGAKKAKSLARRDQRRAYNEFMRSQGEAQRAREAEGAAEREAALAAERQRRQATEAALEAKKAKQREQVREQERREREDEIRRRQLAGDIVRHELEESRMCDLFKVARQIGGDVDEEWVERILHASGLIGRKGDVMTMITGMGWAIRVTADDMARLYQTATKEESGEGDGKTSYEDLGAMLEGLLAMR